MLGGVEIQDPQGRNLRALLSRPTRLALLATLADSMEVMGEAQCVRP
jgi:hypothetical protein